MSNTTKNCEQGCSLLYNNTNANTGCLKMVLKPKDKDLGGFSVRRVLPSAERKMIGPWIFFDHMGPADFGPGLGINVRPHPHIGIATVTYLFEGEILHRDSLGSLQAIRPGDINLMVAGRGIAHSERERPEVTDQSRRLHGLQLWLALPEAEEEIAPAFYHYPSNQIPELMLDGLRIRVMIGEAYGQRSPVKTYAHTLYIEAHLRAGQRLTLPRVQELGVYIAQGELIAQDQTLPEHSLAVFEAATELVVEAKSDSRIALIGGERLGKRYIEWNFVSSRKERIEQAKADWEAGRFAKVAGDEQEFIPLP